jgi:hypothetical protein
MDEATVAQEHFECLLTRTVTLHRPYGYSFQWSPNAAQYTLWVETDP